MLELAETTPNVRVQESEYQRLLGFPRNHPMEGRARELADAARQWYAEHGRPWFYAQEAREVELANGRLHIAQAKFFSRRLYDQFAEAQAHRAVLVAVSAGRECEEHALHLWQESKPDEYYFLELFGSAVVECLVTMASGRICGWADRNGAAALPHYSPGYSGWNVSDQTNLWHLFRRNGAHPLDGRLEVLETGMLRPKKSLLALFGITRHLEKARQQARLNPCGSCSLPSCQYRRSPYEHARQQKRF